MFSRGTGVSGVEMDRYNDPGRVNGKQRHVRQNFGFAMASAASRPTLYLPNLHTRHDAHAGAARSSLRASPVTSLLLPSSLPSASHTCRGADISI